MLESLTFCYRVLFYKLEHSDCQELLALSLLILWKLSKFNPTFTVLDIPTPVLRCTMLKAQRKGMQMLGYLTFWSYMLLPNTESL